MKTFNEWLETRLSENELPADWQREFGSDIDKSRTIMADLFRSVRSLENKPDQVGEHLNFVTSKLSEVYEMLKKYDFKPILGNGVEFRLVNTSVGNLCHPNNMSHLADDFRSKKLSGRILAAEEELGRMHSSVTSSPFNKSYISRDSKGVPYH